MEWKTSEFLHMMMATALLCRDEEPLRLREDPYAKHDQNVDEVAEIR